MIKQHEDFFPPRIKTHSVYKYIAVLLFVLLNICDGLNTNHINIDEEGKRGVITLAAVQDLELKEYEEDPQATVLSFYPGHIAGLNQGETVKVYVNVSGAAVGQDNGPLFEVYSVDETIARVISVIVPSGNETVYTVLVQGLFIGRTCLQFTAIDRHDISNNATELDKIIFKYNDDDILKKSPEFYSHSADGVTDFLTDKRHEETSVCLFPVAVVRQEGWMDQLFIVAVSLVVLITNMGMGCKIDLDVVFEVLKKPIAPVIGFTCQFIIMPLVAYFLIVLFDIQGGQALGFFATGCSPGGGASNMYTYILGGDVSLSVTMTLVSTAASFAMIPFWLYTLGTHFIDNDTNLSIPFENILVSLAGIVIPVGIGIVIQRKKPSWAKSLQKCLKPLFIFLIIFLFTFGMWVNSYLFGLFTVNLTLAASLLPYSGFLLSGLAALACRQPTYRIITIIIETGIQNTGIPILLMKFSLPQPEADMSVVAPVMIAFFTPFPLWIAIAVRELHKKCCISKAEEPTEAEIDAENLQKVFNESEEEPNLSRITSDLTDIGSYTMTFDAKEQELSDLNSEC